MVWFRESHSGLGNDAVGSKSVWQYSTRSWKMILATGSVRKWLSKSIREAALRRRVPYVTTIAGARAWAEAIAAMQATTFDLPPSLQELHRSASSPAES